MPNAIVPQRVTEMRNALGLSQAELAALVGVSQQAIDQIERGKIRRSTRLHEIAKALRASPAYLLGESDMATQDGRSAPPLRVPPGRLTYGGAVQAGLWQSVDDFNQDIEAFEVPDSIPVHPGYPQLEQVAWKVRGDSMSEAGILDGMWAVGARYADYIDKIGELDNGNYVVVERARAQGADLERTIKEVQFGRGRMRLVPRSNKNYPELSIDMDRDADPDVETVRILGVVFWAGYDFDPRAR